MNDLALKRLTAAGWTPDRKVDCSEIECLYREQNLILPDVLRVFFESFAYLGTNKITNDRSEWHYIGPDAVFSEWENVVFKLKNGMDRTGFDGYKKLELQPLFEKNGIIGEIYPVGDAYNGNMDLYYHESGKFYLYMSGGGPLTEIGSNVDEMLNYLFGDDHSTRKDIVYDDTEIPLNGEFFRPTMVSVAINMKTGDTFVGYSGSKDRQSNFFPLVNKLQQRVDAIKKEAANDPMNANDRREKQSYMPWPVENCAEVKAVNKALMENKNLEIEDLFINTRRVTTKKRKTWTTLSGDYVPPCENCQRIFYDAVFPPFDNTSNLYDETE